MGSQQHDSFCVGGTSPYRTGERVSNWILTSRQRHGLTSGQSNTVINQYTLYGSSLVTSTNAVQAQMCIHSKTNVDMAAKVIFDVTQTLDSIFPDAPKLILSEFNHCLLNITLPSYLQHVTCNTGMNKTINLCYGILRDAHKSDAKPRLATLITTQCISFRASICFTA